MSYLLDTDIIVYWLNNAYPSIQKKIENVAAEQIFISSITVAELFFGAYNSSKISENIKLLEELTSEINILSFDQKCGKIFGKIKAQLKKNGEMVNDSDLFIASIAIKNHLCLITNNERHFRRVKELHVENWVIQNEI